MAFRGFLKLSTQVTKTVVMIDSSDHVTGKTGLTITKYLTQAAGTPTAATMTTSELDSTNTRGLYSLVFTTSHTNTLGEFALHCSGTGADPMDDWWEVVTYLPGEAALLQTGSGTGQLDFTSGVVKANATQWLGGTIPAVNVTGVPLIDAKYLLGTVFATPATAGIADVNVKNMNNVAATSITTIKAVQGLAVDGVITTVTNQLTAAQIATGVWTDTTAGDFTTALSIGKSVMNGVSLGTGLKIAECVLADTLTTYTGNTVQTGDSFARIGAAGVSLSAIPDLAGVTTLLSRLSAARAGYLDNLNTGVSLTSGERNSVADALLDRVDAIESGVTVRQSFRLSVAADSGKTDGMATTTVHLRDIADSKNRVTATVDANGNRTAVTRDLT